MKWEDILKAGPWSLLKDVLLYNGQRVVQISHRYLSAFTQEANVRSVDSMLNSVWTANEENLRYETGDIYITGKSGNTYRLALDYGRYCKFDVYTTKNTPLGGLGVTICIDVDEKGARPYGDILATYLLTLIDDTNTAESVDTIETFLNGWYESVVECDFCYHTTEFEDIDQLERSFTCGYCGVFTCDLDFAEEVGAGSTDVPLETSNEEYNCPYCGGGVEIEWVYPQGEKFAVCENDTMVIDTAGHYFPAMRIDGELRVDVEPDADDEDIIIYEGQRYRYTNGIDGEPVEEEE